MQRGDSAEWQDQYSNPAGALKTLELGSTGLGQWLSLLRHNYAWLLLTGRLDLRAQARVVVPQALLA